jgi:hypothetical protein
LRNELLLTLRHHNSQDYARLPDIDSSDAGIISLGDQACLDEIGSCLLRAKANTRFGATLLHSHFKISDDELLLEEALVDEHLITLRPIRNHSSTIFATNVCVDDINTSNGELRLIGLEFTSHQTLAGVAPIDGSDLDILTSLSEILQRHNKAKRFGVRLLHDPLNLGEAALLETCDPVYRVLTSQSETNAPLFARSIPTVFRWEEAPVARDEGFVITQGCMQFCRTVSRCAQPERGGSHRSSRSHEPTDHKSV